MLRYKRDSINIIFQKHLTWWLIDWWWSDNKQLTDQTSRSPKFLLAMNRINWNWGEENNNREGRSECGFGVALFFYLFISTGSRELTGIGSVCYDYCLAMEREKTENKVVIWPKCYARTWFVVTTQLFTKQSLQSCN